MSQPVISASARVVEFRDVAPGVRAIRLEPAGPFAFKAGQYARLTFDGFEERPFSIASAPHHGHLEFHIKSLGHGASGYAAGKLAVGETLTLRGPFGRAFLQPGDAPFLAIGGGLGIAPLKSIIESALHQGHSGPIHLYMGGRHASDLYLEEFFSSLAAQNPQLKVTAVLSEASGDDRHRTGYVGRVAAGDFKELAGFMAYLAGPPAMIEDTLPLLLDKSMARENVFSDAFEAL